jgi:CDP-diacylglycerol--glycerol-3-phosphate 3-phosphatidyltransferase
MFLLSGKAAGPFRRRVSGVPMNIPNAITLLRVVLIPFYIDLMIYGYYDQALAVFLAACVTDALDGLIARLTKTQTELGAFLDPMADKLLIISAFVTLVLIGRLPVWLVIIVVSRDVSSFWGALRSISWGISWSSNHRSSEGDDGPSGMLYRYDGPDQLRHG